MPDLPKIINKSMKKQPRKAEHPVRVPTAPELSFDFGSSNSLVCKNSACKAFLLVDDKFCRRCSCCICHLFDENKDPSLWLVCKTESGPGDSCGFSCHIECALQREKVGVVDLGPLMQVDGSYCCASCGKVSGIIGCWKKQLVLARDAHHVDVLYYRLSLSFRLLDGTSRFKELHEIVRDAKVKLETEVGPLNVISADRGIVSRLNVAGVVRKLCSLAIEKADEWLASVSNINIHYTEDSLLAACKFLFEEITSSSVVIILIELSSPSDDIKGYKLWYSNSREEKHTKEPICVIPRAQRRILISNLQPCTEYAFRIISYTEKGDAGHSEARCFTKSGEKIHKKSPPIKGSINRKRGIEGLYRAYIGKCCGLSKVVNPETPEEENLPAFSHGLDLNVVSVPDLNEELTPPFESFGDEDNNADDDASSRGIEKNGSEMDMCEKMAAGANEETHDCDSTLINGSPLQISNNSCFSDENFENCVKIIRWLERKGHIKHEFRLKLLTWFSLRSTEPERRVINTFIQTLVDDPPSLAAQLVDSFSGIVSCKRPRNGLCSKLWH